MRHGPLLALTGALAVAVVGTACGGRSDGVASERADQIRAAADDAGLPDEVADVLVLAGRGPSATFRISYAGADGSTIVVAQDPPDRRIDIVVGGRILESRVLRDGVGYVCSVPDGGQLTCTRRAGDLRTDGVFTAEALDAFTEGLGASLERLDLTVERRTIADTEATCLVTQPKAGTPLDGTEPRAETICLSPEGAQLLVDAGGERVTASEYGTDVPGGTFDVP